MIITEKWLKQRHACQDGIDFVVRNKIVPFDYDKIKITGDYECYFEWLNFTIKCKNEFDKNGNMIMQTYPNGAMFAYKYDNNNKLIKETNSIEYSTIYEYDKDNVVKKVHLSGKMDPNGDVDIYKYNKNNNLIQISYPNGDIDTFEYDKNNNLIKKIGDDGTITIYNEKGNLVRKIYHDRSVYNYEYFFSSDDKLIKMTENAKQILKIKY